MYIYNIIYIYTHTDSDIVSVGLTQARCNQYYKELWLAILTARLMAFGEALSSKFVYILIQIRYTVHWSQIGSPPAATSL